MGGHELESFVSFVRNESLHAVGVSYVAIDESLREDETASKGDVQLSGIRLACEDNACFLEFAVAELARGVHEHRCDPVNEFTFLFGVHGKVHPAEFLNGREAAGGALLVHAAVGIREVDTVLDPPEAIAVGFFVFEGEADEVAWRLGDLPVHGEESHAVSTVKLQCERSVGVLRDNLKIAEHT